MTRAHDELTARLIELTKDLVLFPGTASRPEDRERCFQFVKNHLDLVERVSVREYRSGGFPSLLAFPEGIETPEVLLCGHLDVVDRPSPEAFRPAVRDARIYGAGAGDMKGQLAVLLEIFRELHSEAPSPSLGLAVTSDEELGGEHGMGYLIDEVGLRCRVAIIPDGGSLNEITVEEKGTVRVRVRARGRAGHGARPWLASNPLERLVERLARLNARFAELGGRGTGERWHPTCALTVLRTENDTPNRIPEEAEAVLDIRFPPPHSVDSMSREVRAVLGEGLEIHPLMVAEPTRLQPDPTFQRVTEELTGEPVVLSRESGGSDARFFCRRGIPVIMSRPIVGNLHGEDEWIDIESMTTLYRIYLRYLRERLLSPRS